MKRVNIVPAFYTSFLPNTAVQTVFQYFQSLLFNQTQLGSTILCVAFQTTWDKIDRFIGSPNQQGAYEEQTYPETKITESRV